MASFADVLKQHRTAAGLTQEELAERAGLSARAISDLERGINRRPYAHTAQRLIQGLALSEEDASRFQRAARGMGDSDDPVRLAAASRPSVFLPPSLTPFIGRKQDVEEVRAMLLRQDVRLLVLTGPGGVGKTRLALEVARETLGSFPDGVVLVPLASLADSGLVPGTIASALGVREAGGQPILETLVEHLHSRRMLLVLDNFEHLVSAAAAASHLLAYCPGLTLLVTSREVLHLSAEHEYPVPPLAVPVSGHVPELDVLSRYDAIQLFVQRAEAVKPGFRLTKGNAAAIAEICIRLDGLPLAIELAATRTKLFPPHDLLGRLSSRLTALTGGARDLPVRQRTLRNTIDWSYALLSSEEQTLFTRLSIFAGGSSFEAAEAVCNPDGDLDLLQGLTSLVDKCLLRPEGDEEPCFTMLDTLREYAGEQLAARGEKDRLRRLHAAYFTAMAEEAEPKLIGSEQMAWLARLGREHDNVRAAFTWSLERAEQAEDDEAALGAEAGLRLAGALFWFWFMGDHHAEGLAWSQSALARGAAASPAVRAKALFGAGVFALSLNEPSRSEALLTESVALNQEIGDRRGYVLSLGALGFNLCQSGQEERAAAVVEEGIALARAMDDPWLLAYALLHRLLRVAFSPAIERDEDRVRARAAAEEALLLFRAAGDAINLGATYLFLSELALYERDYGRARASLLSGVPLVRSGGWRTFAADGLVRLGDVARAQGDEAEATSLYTEALMLYRQCHRQWGANRSPHITAALSHLAHAALEQGDWAAAKAHAAESLAVARELGQNERPEVARTLEVEAALAAVRDAPARALRLAGAAAALRARIEQPLPVSDRATVEKGLDLARRVLTTEESAAAWAEGEAMSSDEAIIDALREGV